jgi:hypothetical protein
MTFEQWMKKVDRLLENVLGIGSSDMRDRLWRDAYDDESTPEQAIEDLVGDLDDPETVMESELFG